LEPLQALETLEIPIETHQPPSIGHRQGRQMGIGAEPCGQILTAQQLVKHLKAIVLRPRQAHPRLPADQWRCSRVEQIEECRIAE
jgi:hypothetical protein